MNKQTIITILFALIAMTGQAQITIKGSIINERGEKVEYVSVGLEEDSIGTISDANGNFTMEIPVNHKNDLVFTHVSFEKAVVPYETYANGQQLTVTMKDKVVELAEVVVGKKNKPRKIAGKTISGPIAAFRERARRMVPNGDLCSKARRIMLSVTSC